MLSTYSTYIQVYNLYFKFSILHYLIQSITISSRYIFVITNNINFRNVYFVKTKCCILKSYNSYLYVLYLRRVFRTCWCLWWFLFFELLSAADRFKRSSVVMIALCWICKTSAVFILSHRSLFCRRRVAMNKEDHLDIEIAHFEKQTTNRTSNSKWHFDRKNIFRTTILLFYIYNIYIGKLSRIVMCLQPSQNKI